MAAHQPARSEDTERADERRTAFAVVCADEARFRAWYESALPRVYGFVYGRVGGDAAAAEDITQQAFVAAVRSRKAFDGRSEPVVWICSIARNALVDVHRRQAREARRHLALVVREIVVDGDARTWERADDRDDLLRALRGLTPDQRTAIFLRYVDDLPVRDVARTIGRSESATESLLSRARDRLRALLDGVPR